MLDSNQTVGEAGIQVASVNKIFKDQLNCKHAPKDVVHFTHIQILPNIKIFAEILRKYQKERGCGKVSKTLFQKPGLGVMQKISGDWPKAAGAKIPIAPSLQAHGLASKYQGVVVGKITYFSRSAY